MGSWLQGGWERSGLSRGSALALIALLLCAVGVNACTSGQMGEFTLAESETKTSGAFAPPPPGVGNKDKVLRLPSTAQSLASAATPGSASYKIGPQDVLDISVFKVPELARSVQVADTGSVNLPLLGEVPAAGKTARELERDLAKRLAAKYLQSPQVTVNVKDYNSQRVTVEGAVKSPGVHVLKGKTTLLQLVAISGGLDPASDSTVIVFRRSEGKRYAARFEIEAIRRGEADDPQIVAGDVIVANSSALKAAWGDFLKTLPVASFAMLLF